MSDAVITTLIVTFGGIIGGYITIRAKSNKAARSQYIDVAFAAYERVLKHEREDNERLREENAKLVAENTKLKEGVK